MDADRKLEALARRRHGVFTYREALAVGVASSTLSRRLRTGRYRKLQPGVYAMSGAPDVLQARLLAAVLAVGGDAVLSHRSAGRHWALKGLGDPERIHVLTPGHRPDGLIGVILHRTKNLPPHHVARHRGIPVTSVDRTICDIAGVLNEGRVRTLVADAVRNGLVAPEDLRRCLEQLGRVRGAVCLRGVLEELCPQEARTRSELEALYLRVTTRAGLPVPEVNHPVRDLDGRRRYLDMAYVDQRVAVELDGQAFHGLRTDRRDDNLRQNALVLADWWRLLRFTWWDLTRQPQRVVRQVVLALEAGGPRIAGGRSAQDEAVSVIGSIRVRPCGA